MEHDFPNRPPSILAPKHPDSPLSSSNCEVDIADLIYVVEGISLDSPLPTSNLKKTPTPTLTPSTTEEAVETGPSFDVPEGGTQLALIVDTKHAPNLTPNSSV